VVAIQDIFLFLTETNETNIIHIER
jgi:hypothetical protein